MSCWGLVGDVDGADRAYRSHPVTGAAVLSQAFPLLAPRRAGCRSACKARRDLAQLGSNGARASSADDVCRIAPMHFVRRNAAAHGPTLEDRAHAAGAPHAGLETLPQQHPT